LTAAQEVERADQHQRDRQPEQQHQQRFLALAGQHAVEHLQAEQRRAEPEQVDRHRKAGDGAQK